MSHQILSYVWFFGLALVWSLYVVQDGFITGGSMLSILYKDDDKTYSKINSILALHWDGIQVWLILAVGGMFAAFPAVYASVLSALYVPFFLLLFAIIFRGVAIEVIYKTDSVSLQTKLKYALTISSFCITLIIGVYLMNTFLGFPIDENGYNNSFFSFLSIFNFTAIFGSLIFVCVSLVQGVNFIRLNTSSTYGPKMTTTTKLAAIGGPFLMAAVFLSFANVRDVFARGLFGQNGLLWLVPVAAIILITVGSLALLKQKHGLSFITNGLGMIAFIFTGFISMVPYAIISTVDSSLGMLIVDGAAGTATLSVMLIALIIFLPIVIGYQLFKYIKFWGRV